MPDDAQEKLKSDTLFLACTRPAMIWGVTMEGFGINLIFTGITFLVMKSIFYLTIGLFIHYIFKLICKYDPNAFRLLYSWAQTHGRCRTRLYWGASTITPLRLRTPRTARDLKNLGSAL